MNKNRWMVLAGMAVLSIGAGMVINSFCYAKALKERQTLYAAILRDYSAALRPGISRREVETYLQQRHHLISRCAASPITEAHMLIW